MSSYRASSPLLPRSVSDSPPRRRPTPAFLPPAITTGSRARPLALLVGGAICLCVLLSASSWSSSFAPGFYLRLTSRTEFRQFNKVGLVSPLYNNLSAIDHRSVVLRPIEHEYERERSAYDKVPWRQEDLLPRRTKPKSWMSKLLGARPKDLDGYEGIQLIRGDAEDPLPVHTIDTFPRKVELKRGHAGTGDHLTSLDRVMFGSVTTVARAREMTKLWTNWMHADHPEQGQPMCLILFSSHETQEDIDDLKILLDERGLPCVLKQSDHVRYEVRVLSMIQQMHEHANSLERSFDWFVFGDDDTFWVDIRATLRMLSKYDPKQEWFVGTSSESLEALGSFGRMAFGGAGIIVSAPLLTNMAGHWPECYERFKEEFGGDGMLTRCAALAAGVERDEVVTREAGLHQYDIPGDSTGILQSGWPVLSLHHYLGGGWVHLFGYGSNHTDFEQIGIIQQVAAFLGGDNMFTRHVFGDGKWLLVNGYSITYFEEPLKPEDLTLLEHTWYVDHPLIFKDRPAIPERHGPGPAKQTFYIETISDRGAVFTYLQADSWDENVKNEERVKLQVYWDGENAVHARR
ncbi:uncharacterized protein JCM15063_000323 [Sporobolomyces koalae]|uniref:uncharacterized protein n=1 Tax=Sporobolomyces koalae TaxID=500713 RepID=UPI003179613A